MLAVVNNEHLTEALRRLRKNSSENNVDRRLVTNILLSFLTTRRADSKRFEMLSLLSTILSWDDTERERAGLQRVGATGLSSKGGQEKGKGKSRQNERSAEEEAAMNEVSPHITDSSLTDPCSLSAICSSNFCSKKPRKVKVDPRPALQIPLPHFESLHPSASHFHHGHLLVRTAPIHPCVPEGTPTVPTFLDRRATLVRVVYLHSGGKRFGAYNRHYQTTRWIDKDDLVGRYRTVDKRIRRRVSSSYTLACKQRMIWHDGRMDVHAACFGPSV